MHMKLLHAISIIRAFQLARSTIRVNYLRTIPPCEINQDIAQIKSSLNFICQSMEEVNKSKVSRKRNIHITGLDLR